MSECTAASQAQLEQEEVPQVVEALHQVSIIHCVAKVRLTKFVSAARNLWTRHICKMIGHSLCQR